MKNWVPDKTYEEDNGSDHVADLVNFKYRIDTDQIIRIVGTVVNRSSTALRALVCFRVYDADGFEVHDQYSDNVKLKPGRSNSATGVSKSFLTASSEVEKSDPRTGPRTRPGLTVTSSSPPPSALCHDHAARSAIVCARS